MKKEKLKLPDPEMKKWKKKMMKEIEERFLIDNFDEFKEIIIKEV